MKEHRQSTWESRLTFSSSLFFFGKSVIRVKATNCLKMTEVGSVKATFLQYVMTWPKMFVYLQLFWRLWCLNLLLSLNCFWLCAFSPADEGVLVWLGGKVFDMVELLLFWDCPLSMIICKFWLPVCLFLSPFLTFSYLSCVDFLRIKWFQCWTWKQNFAS